MKLIQLEFRSWGFHGISYFIICPIIRINGSYESDLFLYHNIW